VPGRPLSALLLYPSPPPRIETLRQLSTCEVVPPPPPSLGHRDRYFNLGEWGVNVKLPPSNSTPSSCGTTPLGNPAPCPTVQGSSAFLQV
jgi:hypothetical protein